MVEAIPDVQAHLDAGCRACLNRLIEVEGANYTGPDPETLPAQIWVCINGTNITAGIHAAVLETIVRVQHPDVPLVRARRPWWRFWA